MDVSTIFSTIFAWIPKISTIVAGCALIATVTPTKVDDKILRFILDVINKIGLNFGKAKNADDK